MFGTTRDAGRERYRQWLIGVTLTGAADHVRSVDLVVRNAFKIADAVMQRLDDEDTWRRERPPKTKAP
jgi:hypothetical protein